MWIKCNNNPCKKDVNDCVVRAISKFTGKSWDYTFIQLSIYCIQKCDMPESNDVWEEYLHDLGCTRSMCFTQHNVKDFCKKHPHGKYILCTYQHVVTVIDGDYYDTWDSGNEIPIYYWKRR